MSPELSLVAQQSQLPTRHQPTPAEMLSAVIEKGVTQDNVAAIEKLVDLYERMEDRAAEKAFAADFVELQKEIPRIQATKVVRTRNKEAMYAYAPFEEIDEQARPICLKYGFTYSFSEGPSAENKLTKICTLQHKGGHKRSNPYTVRIGSGPPNASASQADGAAHSYAKRGALCDALSIVVVGMDNDARTELQSISAGQASYLRARVRELGINEAAFLKWAGPDAKDFEDIPSNRYEECESQIDRKARELGKK